MSPVEDIFVPSPPQTGTNLLHPRPFPVIERVRTGARIVISICVNEVYTVYHIFSLCFSLPVYIVFLVFVCFSCCLQISQAGTRGEENFQSRIGAIGMRKPDA